MRTGLLEFGWGEADSDFFSREIEVGAGDGGADAFAGFSDGFTGHADDIETGKAICGGAFDFDEVAVIAIGDGGIYFCDHGASI